MTTPILTAAAARKPRRNPHPVRGAGGRGRAESAPHNYLAQAPKKQAGAPLGNRNAARPAPEQGDRRAQILALVRAFCAHADAVAASVPGGRP